MQLLPLLVALLLGTFALAFVLYPLYRGSFMRISRSAPPAGAAVIQEREQAAREALQEIELDYQLGNLAESDYRSLRERYTRRAIVAMKSRQEREQELDEIIEEQLRRLREERKGANDEG